MQFIDLLLIIKKEIIIVNVCTWVGVQDFKQLPLVYSLRITILVLNDKHKSDTT